MRAEGWVTVDEAGGLSDLRWPDYGAPETAALRLCDELRRRRLRDDPVVWPLEEVTAFVRDLAGEYAGYWKKGTDDVAGAQRLVAEAVDILVAARVAARDPAGGVRALPAAGRYAATNAVLPAATLRAAGEPAAAQETIEDLRKQEEQEEETS